MNIGGVHRGGETTMDISGEVVPIQYTTLIY